MIISNPKTIEQGHYCVIIEGENKGEAYFKTKDDFKKIPFENLPYQLQELYKKYK